MSQTAQSQPRVSHWAYRWGKRLLAAILIPSFLLISLEIILRTFNYGHDTDFLIRRTHEDGDFWVDNPRFSDRFFPRSMERRSPSVFVPVVKAPNAYRVIVLGSSAAMGDPDPIFGFSRILDVLLSEHFRDSKVEVINTAMVAINSHTVREIAGELDKLSPDAVIVYVGNNEVVGPFGPSSLQGNTPPPLPVIRARLYLGGWRVGQLMEELISVATRRKEEGIWRGMKHFVGRGIDEDDVRLDAVYKNYWANLDDILESVRRAGATNVQNGIMRCVVVPPPVHYRECAPFEGKEADADYQAGVKLWREGRSEEARTLLCRAVDRDRLRFRADSKIRSIARDAVLSLSDPGRFSVVPALDMEDSGSEIFLDHVHMNFSGNYILAKEVFAILSAHDLSSYSVLDADSGSAAMLSESECARRLGYTKYEEWRILGEMRIRKKSPPFTNQSNHALMINRLDSALVRLRPDSSPMATSKLIAEYEQAVEGRPADAQLRWAFARFLNDAGLPDRAANQLRVAVELRPFSTGIRHDLAVAWGLSGMWEKAEEELRRGLEINPSNSDLRYLLADALYRRGRTADAIEEFRRDIADNPGLVESRNTLAWILATSPATSGQGGAEDDAVEAVQLASEALRLSVDENPKILDTLAAAYAAAGDFTRAVETQKRVIVIMEHAGERVPDAIRARLGLYQARKPFLDDHSAPS